MNDQASRWPSMWAHLWSVFAVAEKWHVEPLVIKTAAPTPLLVEKTLQPLGKTRLVPLDPSTHVSESVWLTSGSWILYLLSESDVMQDVFAAAPY